VEALIGFGQSFLNDSDAKKIFHLKGKRGGCVTGVLLAIA
jgi:hypothetical protein